MKTDSISEYRQRVRRAMKWWRSQNPERSPYTRIISHGWAGHCLWNIEGDAGMLMSVKELLEQHEAAERELRR
jgi:hypothetical protein